MKYNGGLIMKNKLFILLTLLGLLLLAACAPSGSQTAGSDGTGNSGGGEKVTIDWWDYSDSEHQIKAINEMIAEYENKNPNVDIKRTFVPFADLKKKLLMGQAAGELPDIVMIDNPDHQSFAAAGIFADLTEEIKKWGQADKYFEGPWSSTVYKGKNYGVPISSNNLALFYNKDLLEEAGIKPPETWEGLKTAAKKLTTNDVYGLSFSAVKSEEGTFQFLPFVWQSGADLDNFDSEDSIEAINLWKSFYDKGYVSPEVLTMEQGDVQLQFAAGNAAMMINGTWQVPALENDPPGFDWGVTTLPAQEKGGTILGGENWAITSTSEHIDIAWDIIKYVNEPERLKEFVKISGDLPSRKDLIQDPYWQKHEHYKAFADGMKVAKARAYGPNYPKISNAIQEMIHDVLSGKQSSEAAVKQAADKIKPLLP